LVGDSKLSWINLHQAPDLVSPPATEIPRTDQESYRLRFSAWSEDRSTYDEALREAGIYFAPRLYEGIGMSFLEAMAMGKAVVAADRPTMNEYLTHNVNGYLFDPEDPHPIPLSRFREMGKAARETVERGHRRWLLSREKIGSWLASTPPKQRRFGAGRKADSRPTRRRAGGNVAPTQISVICLPLSNSADLNRTCASVAAQDYANIELLIAASAPQATGTTPPPRYIPVPKRASPSEAMNMASSRARGEWLLFLKAGDTLLDENVLSEALERRSTHADFLIGH
jgi:hypothetical protein